MIGYIDVGGGMRAVYGAGVLDCMLDNKIELPYFIGVSAGSANIVSFLGEQKERCLRFYRDYSGRKEYMSLYSLLKNKMYLNLDYIYSTLTNEGGEDPLDYKKALEKNCEFYIVATDANTGKPYYFNGNEMKKNNYFALKASCSIPIVCPAFKHIDNCYYDGGLSDPIPVRKAFDDGCDKVIVSLTRPIDYKKKHKIPKSVFNTLMREYPEVAKLLVTSIDKYNEDMEYIKALQKDGKVLILAPDECCGVETLKRTYKSVTALYNKGYNDGKKIDAFLR